MTMMKLSANGTPDVQPPRLASSLGSRGVAKAERETETCQPQPQPQPLSSTALTSPPITPPSPLLAHIFSQSLLDAKDRRAYEVARQRAKRPEDRKKAKNQKRAGGRKNGSGGGGGGWFGGIRTTERGRDDGDAVVADVPMGYEKNQLVHESLSMVEAIGAAETETNKKKAEARQAQPAVRLEDLVRVAKVRKEKADGFEVIPHVRAVIALDESEFAGETKGKAKSPGLEFDDWEHVESCSDTSSSDEDEPRKVPSYAQVVSSKKQ